MTGRQNIGFLFCHWCAFPRLHRILHRFWIDRPGEGRNWQISALSPLVPHKLPRRLGQPPLALGRESLPRLIVCSVSSLIPPFKVGLALSQPTSGKIFSHLPASLDAVNVFRTGCFSNRIFEQNHHRSIWLTSYSLPNGYSNRLDLDHEIRTR